MPSNILYHKILPMGEFRTFDSKPDLEVARTTQIHSKNLAVYKGQKLDKEEADGIFFKRAALKTKKTAVAVTTADCMPILFIGDESGVFLHAGWKGLSQGILKNPLIKDASPKYCLIGPSISLEAFEVQKDFYEHFPEKEFFHKIKGKTHFDLKAKARRDILDEFPEIQLEIAPECTLRQREYHSYRRDKTKERNWNIFSL
ncbi:MAG: polyphenol oxidase family protein [Bacteriovoracaceae bacterium]